MKKALSIITLSALSTLIVTGCVSREQADEKLAKACAAGVEVFLEDGYSIKEIKNQTFGEAREFGNGYREVRVTVLEGDGWYDVDKEYKCIFAENMAPFGISHSADIYQLKFDDQVYGKDGDKILGSIEDITKLTNTVQDALGNN